MRTQVKGWLARRLRALATALEPDVCEPISEQVPEAQGAMISKEAESMLSLDRPEPVDPARPLRGSIRDRMGRSR